MTPKSGHPVFFKAIATHHAHAGVYALSDTGELWLWYRDGARWTRIAHPMREATDTETKPPTPTKGK